jgi:hypothetical protein
MEILVGRQEGTSRQVNPCECGAYPKFIHPDSYYTDTWLQCTNCKKRTRNTGGYHYGYEIDFDDAIAAAITAWNNGELIT